MNETRQSLLFRAQTGEEDAWKDLTGLYRPLIISWLNRQGVPAGDLEDLTQEVLLSVVKHLPTFQHSGQRGAFRAWLRTIICSRTADYWRGPGAAIDAVEGFDHAAVEVQTGWDRLSERYWVSVADNGPGIPPDQLPRIFNIFESTKGARGTGLGLAVSQKILREHGGEIVVQSQVGQGSRFTLSWPRVEE